jgi:uncharacterized protein
MVILLKKTSVDVNKKEKGQVSWVRHPNSERADFKTAKTQKAYLQNVQQYQIAQFIINTYLMLFYKRSHASTFVYCTDKFSQFY